MFIHVKLVRESGLSIPMNGPGLGSQRPQGLDFVNRGELRAGLPVAHPSRYRLIGDETFFVPVLLSESGIPKPVGG